METYLIILEKVLLFILSAIAGVFIVAVCYPRTRKKLPRLDDTALMTQPSDWLCIGVAGYFFLAFVVLYFFGQLKNNIFFLSAPSDWLDIISLSFIFAAWALAAYLFIAGAARVIISVLRGFYYLFSRNQKTYAKKRRFVKSLQFYYGFLAIAMFFFWFIEIVSFNLFLWLLLIFIAISTALIYWPKIINTYNFIHDIIFNDCRQSIADNFNE